MMTLLFRNYYAVAADRAVQGGARRRRRLLAHLLPIMLPMSTPILVVAVILQVTGIWNDFIFGLVFAGRENLPMTVQLNNIVNSTQGERAYNVDMAATMLTGARAARRLFRLRTLVRARHRRRRGEGLTCHGCASRSADVDIAFGTRRRCSRTLDLDIERRRVHRAARPVGLRQVDAAQRHRRPARRRGRADLDRRQATSPGRSRRTAASPWCSSPTRSIRA